MKVDNDNYNNAVNDVKRGSSCWVVNQKKRWRDVRRNECFVTAIIISQEKETYERERGKINEIFAYRSIR